MIVYEHNKNIIRLSNTKKCVSDSEDQTKSTLGVRCRISTKHMCIR